MAEYYRVLAYGTNYNDPVYVGTYTKAEEARYGYEFFKGDREYISAFLYEAHDFSGLIGYEEKDLIDKWVNPNPPERTTIDKAELYIVRHVHGHFEDYYDKKRVFTSKEGAEKGFEEEIKKAKEDPWDDYIWLHSGVEDPETKEIVIKKESTAYRFWDSQEYEEEYGKEIVSSS